MLSRTEKNKKKRNKLKKEETKEKRKKFLSWFFKVFLAIFITVISIISYIYYVSTSTLTVREYSKVYNNLPKEFHGLKIVQFGDLYYDNNYSNILKILNETINKLKPDLVLFTGGLIHKNYNLKEEEKENIINRLKDIRVNIGKYYVLGDNDNEEVVTLLNKAEFSFLDDTTEEIYYNSTTPIILHGINQKYSIDYKTRKNLFKINLVNNPDNADKILNYNSPDIIMSGKTLNGQLRIPYLGGVLISKASRYHESYYKINNTDLYITGGIGTNNLPIRTFNHPSINFYRLRAY